MEAPLLSGQQQFLLMLTRQIGLIVIELIAALCMYFGYKLFWIATEKQGEMSLKNDKAFALSLKNVAPGIWFAFFGSAILVSVLLKTVEITNDVSGTPVSAARQTSQDVRQSTRAYPRGNIVASVVGVKSTTLADPIRPDPAKQEMSLVTKHVRQRVHVRKRGLHTAPEETKSAPTQPADAAPSGNGPEGVSTGTPEVPARIKQQVVR